MTTLHDELSWRAQVDAAMRADDGWLTLAGLFWLNPGVNTFGSGEDQDIVFPANSCPAHLGVFIRDENDNVSIELTAAKQSPSTATPALAVAPCKAMATVSTSRT